MEIILNDSSEDDPIIDLTSDDYFMGQAMRQALKAYEAEEVPIGAVVVREGRIIARAANQVETLKDATAHAEMLAITQAENALGDWRLTDCDLYVTKEPRGSLQEQDEPHRTLPQGSARTGAFLPRSRTRRLVRAGFPCYPLPLAFFFQGA